MSAAWRATSSTARISSCTGVEVAVDFVARLRGQVRFDGIDALITQMHADVAGAKIELGLSGR